MRLVNLLPWLPGHSGFGSYVQRVLPGLEGWRLQLGDDGNAEIVSDRKWLPQSPPWAPRRRMRLLQRYSLVQHGVNLPDVLKQNSMSCDQIEVIYSPFFDSLLCWPNVPQLITCHDLTPLVASNSRKAWLRYRFWQPQHCRVATRLIAISRYVADQLVDFGVNSSAIEVIPNGITIKRPRVPSPVSADLLALARHDFNKNLPAMFRGIAKLQEMSPRWTGVLRIVGRSGRQTALVNRLQRDLPNPKQVQLIDTMSQQDLLTCMRSSLALVSASIEEGFDYPILEAKAEGIPTIVSDISVHREFHDGSSLFFSTADDGTGLAENVHRLLFDPCLWNQLSRSGLVLAEHLSVETQQSAIRSQLKILAQ